MAARKKKENSYSGRSWIVLCGMLGIMVAFLSHAAVAIVLKGEMYREKAANQHVRHLTMQSKRGNILDRNGEALAVSGPVDTIIMNTPDVVAHLQKRPEKLEPLIAALNIKPAQFKKLLRDKQANKYVVLARQRPPGEVEAVKALRVHGMSVDRGYRRFYPDSYAAASIIGMTDIEDSGQEGIELLYNDYLTGENGKQRVLRNRSGEVVEYAGTLKHVRNGHDLALTIDRRIQSITYDALKAAVETHGAKGGAAVVIDIKTGDILSVVSEPTSSPNQRKGPVPRHRAITDANEPGSVMKPFAIAAALQAGVVTPNTVIPTAPGQIKIGRFLVRDTSDYGDLTVGQVIAKSSNVGAALVALQMSAEQQLDMVGNLGFFESTGINFPGEPSGSFEATRWGVTQRSSLSRGYGMTATLLQVASAYATVANDGVRMPLRLTVDTPEQRGRRVLDSDVAQQVRDMLELVITDGTGSKAAVPMYRVGGKTGTAYKVRDGKYQKDVFQSSFAGFAPASNPRLAMAILIDEPSGEQYYGGLVAGPVFSQVMGAALRIYNVPPDSPIKPAEGLIARAGVTQ